MVTRSSSPLWWKGNFSTPSQARQGGLFGIAYAGARQDDGELLAAVTRDNIHFAHFAAEHFGHAPQHFVARLMPVPIVERLEVIDIGHDEREGASLAAELGTRWASSSSNARRFKSIVSASVRASAAWVSIS